MYGIRDVDMQRQAWIYTISAAVLGALDLLFRWLQCQSIFDPETGLPTPRAGLSTLVVVLLVLTVVVLWRLSGRLSPELTMPEPEEALRLPNRVVGALMTGAGVLAALGAVVMFFTESSMFMRLTALLGLFSAVVLSFYPSLPKWGGFGAALSLVPVLFFSLWLVSFYRANAVNPIVWAYGVEILGIAACLLGAFRLSGLLFYRTGPRQGLFALGLGLCLGLTELMDRGSAGERLLFLGWALGFGTLSWVIVRNFGIQGPPPAAAPPAGRKKEKGA